MTKKYIFKGIDALIFDLDGTLVDSMNIWHDVDKTFFAMRNIEVPPDFQKEIGHRSFRGMAEYAIQRFSLPDTPDDLINIWTELAKDEYATKIKCKNGAKEFLKKAKAKGLRISLCTSNKPDLFMPCIINNNIEEYFDNFLDVNTLKTDKHSPDIYLKASELMNSSPERSIVFEDLLMTVTTAKKAGFRTIAVEDYSSKDDKEEMEKVADHTIHDYTELLDLL